MRTNTAENRQNTRPVR